MAKVDSVEGLLAPSLRVSRPVAACSRCRSAKIKCDGKLPACTACERAGKASSCSGANDDFAKGKERSYVAALEGACERLQRRIAELRATRAPDETLQPIQTEITGSVQGGTRTIKQEASDVDDLVGDFGFLSVNATSRDFHGFTGTTSFAKLLLTLSLKKDLPYLSSRELPPRYYASQLIEQYMSSIHALMPILSETGLMASFAAVYQDLGCKAKAWDHWTVRMVLAIAASNFHGDDTPTQKHALLQVCTALEYAEEVLHPGSIAGLQAVLLLAQYSMIDPEYFNSWQLIGMASRVMVDLGLHQDPGTEARTTKDILDLRRRVFTALYCMDRQISMASSQPFSFTDDSTAVEPPLVQQSSLESEDGLFLHSIRPSLSLSEIRKIQSRSYQFLYQSSRQPWEDTNQANTYVWSVYSSAQKWFDSIPASLSQQHQRMLKLELIYTQLFILSPSTRIPSVPDYHKGLFFEFSLEFVEMTAAAIQNIVWHPFMNFYDILRVQNIANTFLTNLWVSYNQIISGHISEPPRAREANIPPPPKSLMHADTLANVDRALHFFHLTHQILNFARQKWNLDSLGILLEQDSVAVLNKLRLHQAQLQQRQPTTQARQDQRPADTALRATHSLSQSAASKSAPLQDQQWANLSYQSIQTDHDSDRSPPHGLLSSSLPRTQIGQRSAYGMTADPRLSRTLSSSKKKNRS